ncbi:MAG: hypothetical protein GF399_08370 [Candidatus Coatesbacteria bacterium]|nr:hypothetical protein [Candidatus Coatesbacteria bacterium]
MQEELSPAEAETELQLCLDNGLIPTSHFRKELKKEQRTMGSIRYVLINGSITKKAVWDTKRENWKYRIEGLEPDGKWLVIIFCFSEENEVILITVYSEKNPNKQVTRKRKRP